MNGRRPDGGRPRWSLVDIVVLDPPQYLKELNFLNMLSEGNTRTQQDILDMYAGFVKKLWISSSYEVNILLSIVSLDIRTQTSRNIRLVSDMCARSDILLMSSKEIRFKLDALNIDIPPREA